MSNTNMHGFAPERFRHTVGVDIDTAPENPMPAPERGAPSYEADKQAVEIVRRAAESLNTAIAKATDVGVQIEVDVIQEESLRLPRGKRARVLVHGNRRVG